MAWTDDDRKWLRELLPKAAHAPKWVDPILDAITPETVGVVEIVGARVAVDEVEAYGLIIRVDANGNAVSVSFPYGAEVTEVTS